MYRGPVLPPPPSDLARFLRGAPARANPGPDLLPVEEAAWFDAQVAAGALVAVSESGGKDSGATLAAMAARVPARQLVVIHADLHEAEWPGTLDVARAHAAHYGLPFVVARALDLDGRDMDLFRLVQREYDKDPTHAPGPRKDKRNCTSDLKRGPIWREIGRYAQEHGFGHIISAQGHRAGESSDRAAMTPVSRLARKSWKNGKRDWFDYLPIFSWSEEDVWRTMRASGLTIHPAYLVGARRLSCAFCFYSSAEDMRVAALHNPELYAKMVAFEEGHRRPGTDDHYRWAISKQTLRERVGFSPEEALARRRRLPMIQPGAAPRYEVVAATGAGAFYLWDHLAQAYRPEPFENPEAARRAATLLAQADPT